MEELMKKNENTIMATQLAEEAEHKEAVIFRAIGAAIIALGFLALYLTPVLSVFFWILGIILWNSADPGDLKEDRGYVCVGRLPGHDIPSICNEFGARNYGLGTPWIGTVRGMHGPCMIFGPDQEGFYMYAHKELFFGRIFVARNAMPQMISGPADAVARIREEKRSVTADYLKSYNETKSGYSVGGGKDREKPQEADDAYALFKQELRTYILRKREEDLSAGH